MRGRTCDPRFGELPAVPTTLHGASGAGDRLPRGWRAPIEVGAVPSGRRATVPMERDRLGEVAQRRIGRRPDQDRHHGGGLVRLALALDVVVAHLLPPE